MNRGEIVQIDSPMRVYHAPKTAFVRDFLGKSTLLRGRVIACEPNGHAKVSLHGSAAVLTARTSDPSKAPPNAEVVVAARPEDTMLELGHSGDAGNCLNGTIRAVFFVGDRIECHVQCGDHHVVVYLLGSVRCREGEKVQLHFRDEGLKLWPA
jgi:ABC-type Fe3+/spermidine/putrescine transport system ATPase subunit